MLWVYLPSSMDLKLCSDVSTSQIADLLRIFFKLYENAGMEVRGWKCKDENAGMKMLGMKKPGDESEKIKCPRMKCHAAKSVWVIVGKKSSNNRIVHSAAMVDWNFQSSCSI